MDQPDQKEDERASLPQQEQIQEQGRRQGIPHQPQSQPWSQRAPGYQLPQQRQQPPYPVSVSQRQYGQQQEMANPLVASGAMLQPPPQGGQDMEYHSQHHGAAPAVAYPPMHQSAGTTSHYASYPQQYQPPPPQQISQQMYQQQQMAMSQGIPQQMHVPQQQQQQQQRHLPPMMEQQQPPHAPSQPYIQPTVGRLPADRPLVKLSVSLIDTYKRINKVYYEERDARRAARAAQKASGQKGQGINNNGWDDENYDYILTNGELFYGRYIIKERIGKGSFGQVVRGHDMETNKDVAIKIIKSKKPFLVQAKTEIELLSQLCEKDAEDQHNIVRLVTHFIYRNHQCLVFEMLSLNLYELLKNTQFGGVSLNLIRKFAKQILKSLGFLARPDVDIIHCDLKPENVLLRHPKRSGVKVIDFGSSCRSNRRMYSYIQSRFYRSPEVMLGLPYSVAIDMWSLGCILAEMHTGEPLFSGSDQFDQMQKIVKLLGMMPNHMLEQASDQNRLQFFSRTRNALGIEEWVLRQTPAPSASTSASKQARSSSEPKEKVVPSTDPIASLSEVIGAESTKRKKYPPTEPGTSARNYEMFVDLIHKMLAYDPTERIKPQEALNHPFIFSGDQLAQSAAGYPTSIRRAAGDLSTQEVSYQRMRTQSENTQMEDVEGSTPGQDYGDSQKKRANERRS